MMEPAKEFTAQITRIKSKLEQVRELDADLKVFGASSHKYQIGKSVSNLDIELFEKQYAVKLPSAYTAFLQNIGNGGQKPKSSAAGPYYGIYALGQGVGEWLEHPDKYLNKPAVIYPKMPKELWERLTHRLNFDGDISDEDYDEDMGHIFSGLLPIGTQGCQSYHALVLVGEYAGRVVNLDTDYNIPLFAYERNFLDWYERWLDEISSGILLQEAPNWFGYTMGGDESVLLQAYTDANDIEDKIAALNGFGKLLKIGDDSCNQLLALCDEKELKIKHIAVQTLTKFNYKMAKPHLTKLIQQNDADCLVACQSIFWHAKSFAGEWVALLQNRLRSTKDSEVFTFITYILKEAGIEFSADLTPFCDDKNEDIRVTAFYSLGLLKTKHSLVDVFIQGLRDPSPRVVHITLQALDGVKDRRLLTPYYEITERIKTDDDYILINLKWRLQEFGYKNQEIFVAAYRAGKINLENRKNVRKPSFLQRIFDRK